MKIRKEFKVESAHIVRNCTSHRCSHSIHGHSAVIEVFLESTLLDNAGMVYDFGLMKGTVKSFIDSMDHCYILCEKDAPEFRDFIKQTCDRWIELPFNPSAECLSMFVMFGVNQILDRTQKNNGESGNLRVTGVRYHETTTGWAECNQNDLGVLWQEEWGDQIKFSDGVLVDWHPDLGKILEDDEIVDNPIVKQQINLK
jgi:6-pyruvoyltetrahydropterin/6-carboxytetrahydropterin synthase